MAATQRFSNAVLALLIGSIFSGTVMARKPESDGDRERSASKGAQYDVHKVSKGETLWSVAMDYHTSAGEIMDFNGMENSRIVAGQTLKIPRPGAQTPAPVVRQKTYVVTEDDSVHSIARRFEVSDEALLRANPDVNPKRLRPGTRMVIPTGKASPGVSLDAPPRGQEFAAGIHVVRDNETFTSIARQHHVSVADVMAANPGVKPERLQEGMKIKIPGSRPTNREDAPRSPVKKSSYIVQPGDTLERISRRQGVPVASIMRANGIVNPHVLTTGTILAIPGGREPNTVAFQRPDNAQAPIRQRPPMMAATHPQDPYGPPVRNTPPAVQRQTQAPSSAGPKPQKQAVEFSYEKQAVISKPNYQPQAAPAAPRTYSYEGGSAGPHIVQPGESVDSIAVKHGLTARQLRDYNHLRDGTTLRPGEEIIIPDRSSVASR